jgi:hypothetical protein
MVTEIVKKGTVVNYKKDGKWVSTPPLKSDYEVKCVISKSLPGYFFFKSKVYGEVRTCGVRTKELVNCEVGLTQDPEFNKIGFSPLDLVKIPGWFKKPARGGFAQHTYAHTSNKYWHFWFVNKGDTGMRFHHDGEKIKLPYPKTMGEFMKVYNHYKDPKNSKFNGIDLF